MLYSINVLQLHYLDTKYLLTLTDHLLRYIEGCDTCSTYTNIKKHN